MHVVCASASDQGRKNDRNWQLMIAKRRVNIWEFVAGFTTSVIVGNKKSSQPEEC